MKTILIILAFTIVLEALIVLCAWMNETEKYSFMRNLVAAHILGYSLIIAVAVTIAIDFFILEKYFK